MKHGWEKMGSSNDLSADQGVPSFQPFRFESRRSRIDWRLLHGVDINNIVGPGAGFDRASMLILCMHVCAHIHTYTHTHTHTHTHTF